MSCYFRHIQEVFDRVGVELTQDRKQLFDQAIHRFLHVEYKNCPPTWKAFKDQIRDDDEARQRLVKELKKVARAQ